MLIELDKYPDKVIVIDPKESVGDVIELHGLFIALPKKPKKRDILFHKNPKKDQKWERIPLPEDLSKIKSMDEWYERPPEFRRKYEPYVVEEFRRRREGVWFYNYGVPTYITGRHYMFLQWTKMDIGYPSYLSFQRDIFIHFAACEADPRSLGQLYTKCRRSGYTNICSNNIVDEGSQVKNKLLGIQSKTGSDAQENIFIKKVVPMFTSYPFFFKPIQDGTTNPRMELAFREPAKRITKSNKTSNVTEALNTIINWKNTTNNAYDGEKVHLLYLDEAGKMEKPADIREMWRIEKTCLIVGRKVVGKAMMGSTVNPMEKGGKEYKALWGDSNVFDRNANGRTASGLYRIFIPAYEALEGFFDVYGNPVIDSPEKPVMGIDGIEITIGAKEYLRNERESLKHDAKELNEFIRQFPFSEEEAFRDSIDGALFNIGKIYQQIDHNDNLFPNPVVKGNFMWVEKDKKVAFSPDRNGRFSVAWMPPEDMRNVVSSDRGKRVPPFALYGCGGVDSYDLDAASHGAGSKGAMHLYTKFNMSDNVPNNMFVVEYVSRPDMARIFYEDVLMCSFFYGYPLLIENNKYGIVRYFEDRGYDGYVMDRPEHLKNSTLSAKTKGVPSSVDVIQVHAQAIEAYIHEHVGENLESGDIGKMYFNKTLEDWIGYDIKNRTKYDLTVSSGLALLASQKTKQVKRGEFSDKAFFRKYKVTEYHR